MRTSGIVYHKAKTENVPLELFLISPWSMQANMIYILYKM